MLLLVSALLIFTATAISAVTAPWNSTFSDKLRGDLLTGYDRFSRPYANNNATTVQLGLTLTHIDIDEIKSMMLVDAWIKLFWTDEKLKWNAEDYGGLSSIHFADEEIWKPDVVLYNSAAGSDIDHYGHTQCISYSTGRLIWVPPTQFKAYCDLDLRKWPRDQQSCVLKMGSWTHHTEQIDLQLKEEDEEPDIYINSNTSEWELVKFEKQRNERFYPCCTEAYADATFTITMKRRSPNFMSLIVIPAAVVVLLTLAGFWMPPEAGERVVLNALTALIICDLQRAVTQKLPDASGATPYILLFYSWSLALATLSLLVSVLVIYLTRSPRPNPPPTPIKQVLTGLIGKVLCVSAAQQPRGREMKDRNDIASGDNLNYTADWLGIARVIDRLAFFVCCAIFVILAIALF